MNYAKIKDNIVENIISLRRSQAEEFPDCIEIENLPVSIGDVYQDGFFYHNEKQVKTEIQILNEQLQRISSMALDTEKEVCVMTNTAPSSSAGIFIAGADFWKPNKEYKQYDMFNYNGSIGWVKQAHTSQENWIPFSVGTEALYGARPQPDEDGIYPYVYNMAVKVGMLVRDEEQVYECIQETNDLLWAPHTVPALFKLV